MSFIVVRRVSKLGANHEATPSETPAVTFISLPLRISSHIGTLTATTRTYSFRKTASSPSLFTAAQATSCSTVGPFVAFDSNISLSRAQCIVTFVYSSLRQASLWHTRPYISYTMYVKPSCSPGSLDRL